MARLSAAQERRLERTGCAIRPWSRHGRDCTPASCPCWRMQHSDCRGSSSWRPTRRPARSARASDARADRTEPAARSRSHVLDDRGSGRRNREPDEPVQHVARLTRSAGSLSLASAPAHRNLTECSPPREDTGWSLADTSIRRLDEHGPMHRHVRTGGAERMNAGVVCGQQAEGRLRGEAR